MSMGPINLDLQTDETKKRQWRNFLKFVKEDPSTLMSLVQAEPKFEKRKRLSMMESP